MIQKPFATHQQYNVLIERLLSRGHKVYIASYFKNGEIKYKVDVSFYDTIKAARGYKFITITRIELGGRKPHSYWGQVELDVLKALKGN